MFTFERGLTRKCYSFWTVSTFDRIFFSQWRHGDVPLQRPSRRRQPPTGAPRQAPDPGRPVSTRPRNQCLFRTSPHPQRHFIPIYRYRKTTGCAPSSSASTLVAATAWRIDPRPKGRRAAMDRYAKIPPIQALTLLSCSTASTGAAWPSTRTSYPTTPRTRRLTSETETTRVGLCKFHCRLTPLVCGTINMIYTWNRFHEDEEETPNSHNDYTTHPYSTQSPFHHFTPSRFNSPFSTTKSPYDFNSFARHFTSQNPYQGTKSYFGQTTPNPYVGNYYQLRRQTTKSPYDFANFGRNTYDISNNDLKRSYNPASYFSDSSNVRNKSALGSRGR